MYSIKNMKTFASRDGGGFEVSLYKNNKKIAMVSNGGFGGPNDWYRVKNGQDPEIERAEMKVWCLANCKPVEFHGKTLDMTPGMYIDELMSEVQLVKDLKKWLKKITMIDNGQVLTFKEAWDPRYSDSLAKQYPNATLLNTLPFDDALALVRETSY